MSSADELKKENVDLIKRIAELKAKLGISPVHDQIEEKRIRDAFAMFDADGNGYIDRSEFEVLAYECGSGVNALAADNIDKAFQQVDTSGDGKIQYDEFYGWLTADKELPISKNTNLLALRLRLLSQSWAKKVSRIREELEESKNVGTLPSSSTASASSSSSSADSKANDELLNLSVNVGDFDQARSSIVWQTYDDANDTAKISEQIDCPSECTAYVLIDFKLKKCDQDESEWELLLGELIGMVETVVDLIPWQQVPFHHSHTVDIYDDEETGDQFLRLVAFSNTDPYTIVANLAVGQGDDNAKSVVKDLVKVTLSVEAPVSLDDFAKNPNLPLTPDLLKARVDLKSQLNREAVERAERMLEVLSPHLRHELSTKLAFLKFLYGMKLNLQFGDIEDFLTKVPLDKPGSMSELKKIVQILGRTAIGLTLQKFAGMAKGLAASQRNLYNTLLDTLVGLSSVRVHASSFVMRLDVKGLDFVQFFQKIEDE